MGAASSPGNIVLDLAGDVVLCIVQHTAIRAARGWRATRSSNRRIIAAELISSSSRWTTRRPGRLSAPLMVIWLRPWSDFRSAVRPCRNQYGVQSPQTAEHSGRFGPLPCPALPALESRDVALYRIADQHEPPSSLIRPPGPKHTHPPSRCRQLCLRAGRCRRGLAKRISRDANAPR